MAGRTLSLPPVEQLRDRCRRAFGYRAMTQKEVAAAIGVSENTLSNVMRGNTSDPGVSLVYQIAKALNVSADYLLGLSDEIERKTN